MHLDGGLYGKATFFGLNFRGKDDTMDAMP
jgi:hypothetical protein